MSAFDQLWSFKEKNEVASLNLMLSVMDTVKAFKLFRN